MVSTPANNSRKIVETIAAPYLRFDLKFLQNRLGMTGVAAADWTDNDGTDSDGFDTTGAAAGCSQYGVTGVPVAGSRATTLPRSRIHTQSPHFARMRNST